MIAFLDKVVTYISSVSSVGAYGALTRLSLSATPTAQTAVLSASRKGGEDPIRLHDLELLVRDTDVRTAAARAEGLHALFDDTWVTTCGLSGHFTAEHDVGPRQHDPADYPVFRLTYHFKTAQTDL